MEDVTPLPIDPPKKDVKTPRADVPVAPTPEIGSRSSTPSRTARSRAFDGRWIWLFPLTYVAHAIEETWGGVGYAAWISGLRGATLSDATLIALHVVLIVGMSVVVAVVRRRRRFFWSIVAFGVVLVGNALLHVAASAVTRTYSPGLFSGVVVWGPLGVYALVRARRDLARADLVWGAAIGLVATLVITVLALNPSLLQLP